MTNLPVSLAAELEPALVRAIDPGGKLVAALDAVGPIGGRDVLVVDATGGPFVDGLRAAGARLSSVALSEPLRLDVPDASVDVVIGLWSAFRGVDAADIAEVDRVLRPNGRLLVVHDYGRDDVAKLRGDLPEYGAWSHRSGPFLTGGFRVRVVHCFWEFSSLEEVGGFLTAAFGQAGSELAARLKRPRLAWNVAIYHRTRP
jgi:SAM-dependent methyltransferase